MNPNYIVAAIFTGISILFLIPLVVSAAEGPYAYEQYCLGSEAGSYCCNPIISSSPNNTGCSPILTNCQFQSLPYGSCCVGKILYCPNTCVPAPFRLKSWVEPLFIVSTVMFSISTFTAILIFRWKPLVDSCNGGCWW